DDHGDIALDGDLLDHRAAAALGQRKAEEHQVGTRFLDQAERLVPGIRPARLMSRFAQDEVHDLVEVWVVVHNQDSHRPTLARGVPSATQIPLDYCTRAIATSKEDLMIPEAEG